MDLETRLTALQQLVTSRTDAGRQLLAKEFAAAEGVLRSSTVFDELEVALRILRVIGVLFAPAALQLLSDFCSAIGSRQIKYADEPFAGYFNRFRNSEHLAVKSIEVMAALRYLDTSKFVQVLLPLALIPNEKVAKKAREALGELAGFNLRVFYGDEGSPGLGAQPQLLLLEVLSGLSDERLKAASEVVHTVLPQLLSPTMEGTSWSYKSLTISRSATPAVEGISQLRDDAITLAMRFYGVCETAEQRAGAIRILVAATRREGASGPELSKMFERDANRVLSFLASRVDTEDLQVVQRIEHDVYWIYFHSGPEIKREALRVRDAIARRSEYTIYKTLIGFEGIFGDWEDVGRQKGGWANVDALRRKSAAAYIQEIDDETFPLWQSRILNFARTKSDDLATFPVFYEFLEQFAKSKPDLAFRLLTKNEDHLSGFLIPLIRGLWAAGQPTEIEPLVVRWVEEGRHLQSVAKSLISSDRPSLAILEQVIHRAAATGDKYVLVVAMGVAARAFGERAEEATNLFMCALQHLSQLRSADWARGFWNTRDFDDLLRGLSPAQRLAVLDNLQYLPKIDYAEEHVLLTIAEVDSAAVLAYLNRRLDDEEDDDGDGIGEREAIPYRFDELDAVLGKHPGEILALLRARYEVEDPYLFSYRGARLVRAIFHSFDDRLEGELLRYVGRADEKDLAFVLSILRTYDGIDAILLVCKAIVKATPPGSDMWGEVAAVIESTGVVHGEFGIAEAYENKKLQIAPWLEDSDIRVQGFAKWLTESLAEMAESERRRSEESVELRKFRYGVDGRS